MDHVLEIYSQPLLEYGSIALFFLLTIGIIAIPVPEETLLITAGFLIGKGKLAFAATVSAAFLGGMCGISISYIIGRFGGYFLVEKYGRWVRITPEKLARAHRWFDHIGIWVLFIGYFFPIIRHLTGYLTGTLRIDYRKFALFAYSGVIFWASMCLLIGYSISRNSAYISAKIVHLINII